MSDGQSTMFPRAEMTATASDHRRAQAEMRPLGFWDGIKGGCVAGVLIGVTVASIVSGQIDRRERHDEAARLAREVKLCAGDYVRLESGNHICRVPMFWRKIKPAT